MKSIVTNFLHKILLSAIFLGSLGHSVQSALVPVSKDLVPVGQKKDDGAEKRELIKSLDTPEVKEAIAKFLAARDEQNRRKNIESSALKMQRTPSDIWRRVKNNSISHVRSVLSKVKSTAKSTGDTVCVGLGAGAVGMVGAMLSHWAFISPAWLREMNIQIWPAAYTSFMLGALGTVAYYMWQRTAGSKYNAARNILFDLCEDLGIPVPGLSIKEGNGKNKICSEIYNLYKNDVSSKEISRAESEKRQGLIKTLLLTFDIDKSVVSREFAQYRAKIDEALKKLEDVIATTGDSVKELHDTSWELAAILCEKREKLVKINTDLTAIK